MDDHEYRCYKCGKTFLLPIPDAVNICNSCLDWEVKDEEPTNDSD